MFDGNAKGEHVTVIKYQGHELSRRGVPVSGTTLDETLAQDHSVYYLVQEVLKGCCKWVHAEDVRLNTAQMIHLQNLANSLGIRVEYCRNGWFHMMAENDDDDAHDGAHVTAFQVNEWIGQRCKSLRCEA